VRVSFDPSQGQLLFEEPDFITSLGQASASDKIADLGFDPFNSFVPLEEFLSYLGERGCVFPTNEFHDFSLVSGVFVENVLGAC
jgi:hypothetical protein